MPRRLVPVGCGVMLTAMLGCTTSPAAPTSLGPPSAAKFAGDYALTIQIDEKCVEFPDSLKIWTYRAVLEDQGYISIRVVGGAFTEPTVVGQFYLQDESRFRFVLNFNYDELDHYPKSPELLLYGSGEAIASESTISGAILGSASLTGRFAGIGCAGPHRFIFARQTGSLL